MGITQPLRWARAEIWELYYFLVAIKETADAAYAADDLELCHFKVEQAFDMMEGVSRHNSGQMPSLIITDYHSRARAHDLT